MKCRSTARSEFKLTEASSIRIRMTSRCPFTVANPSGVWPEVVLHSASAHFVSSVKMISALPRALARRSAVLSDKPFT